MNNPIPKCAFGLPGGSGTWARMFPEELGRKDIQVISYYPEGLLTPYGQSGPAKLIEIDGEPTLCFIMHGWHNDQNDQRIPMSTCAKQVAWCFKEAGVEYVLLAASVGGIQNPDKPGEPLGPWSIGPTTDLIAPWTPPDEEMPFKEGDSYPRMAELSCAFLREKLISAAHLQPQLRVFTHGTYVGTHTRLETPAEIESFRQNGAHVVGQTFQYEAPLWRKLGFHTGHLWIVSNHAESGKTWIGQGNWRKEWLEFYLQCAIPCGHILLDAIKMIVASESDRQCQCAEFSSLDSPMIMETPASWPTQEGEKS